MMSDFDLAIRNAQDRTGFPAGDTWATIALALALKDIADALRESQPPLQLPDLS